MPDDPDLAAARAAVAEALVRLPAWEAMPPTRFERDGGWIAGARDRGGGCGSIAVAASTEAGALRELAALLEERAAGR